MEAPRPSLRLGIGEAAGAGGLPVKYDVAGLGNAIVDVLVRFPDDSLLQQLKLTRGIMHPVSHEEWQRTYLEVKGLGADELRLCDGALGLRCGQGGVYRAPVFTADRHHPGEHVPSAHLGAHS